jgi:hypothetical protein
MAVQIQLRNGTAAQWTAANPVLAAGEVGIESDTRKQKFGDGTTAWNSLSYAGGTGTVTGVTAASPVLSSGGAIPSISLASGYGDTLNPYASKTANQVLAAPNGTSGVPSFRALVSADIPTLNQNTTGTAAGLSSTLAIGSGGTGQTSAISAFNALAPSQSGNSGKYLTTDGTNSSWGTVSGGGSPGGSNTQVQFNSSGSFGGSANLTFNGSVLTAAGLAGPLDGTVGATTPAAGTFTTATARAAATQDSVVLQGRAGGTSSYAATITPTTLTASRTVTLPDANINFATGLPVANGGTGQTTASAAFDALAPSQTGNSGKYLTTNGTTTSWGTVSGSSQWTTTGSNIYYSAGAVGVGTSTVTYPLDVFGGNSSGATPGIRTQFTNGANGGCIQIGNDPSGAGILCGLRIYGDTGGGSVYDTYRTSGGAPFHQFQVNQSVVMTIGTSGQIVVPFVYGNTVTTPRNVFIDSSGNLGGISSVRESKTNINALSSVAWIQQLNPVTFNYRKKDEDGAFTEEFESENQFGLIAEEVEAIQPDLCIYVDGKLQGVHYDRIIAPLIKAIQELTARIAALEAK